MILDLVEKLVKTLIDRQNKVAFAESCTGGLISAEFSKRAGVSSIFQGSVVAYSNQVKADVLGVGLKDLEQFGAVSEVIAKQMAQGACRVLSSDWSVSVTGIAGPSGGTPEKPVGMVCFGVCGPGIAEEVTRYFSGHRERIQRLSAEFAFQLLVDRIQDLST